MTDASRNVERPTTETVFGFWVYIMTDCMVFASLFAVFAVLRTHYAGGPTGHELFDLKSALEETVLLLLSSAACGYAMLALHRRAPGATLAWLAVTFCLGAGFLGLEISEFVEFIGRGAGPGRSAFLSAFFTLVGTHGFHVFAGLIWMLVLVGEIVVVDRRLAPKLVHRLIAFSLFWHFLDVIWICIFTFVYLHGVL